MTPTGRAVPEGSAVPDADPELPDVPEPEAPQSDGARSRFRRIVGIVVPLLVGAAAVATVVGIAGDTTSMFDALRDVRTGGLWLAIAAEAASYLFLGLHLRALAGPGDNIQRLAPWRLATVLFGLGAIMPASPAEGIVMADAALKHRRLDHRRTVLVLAVSQVFGTTGIYLLAALDAIAVVLSAHDGPLAARTFLLAGGFGTLVVLCLLAVLLSRRRFAEVAAVIAGRIRHPRRPAPVEERRRRGIAWHDAGMHIVNENHTAPWLVVTILCGWALDGLCLFFSLAAVGVHKDMDVLLLAYSAAAAASVIPFLPAGLGVTEALIPGLLHLYGVPFAAGLAGLLVYRGVGTVLPAAVGAGSIASMRLLKPPPPSHAVVSGATTGAHG